MTQLLAFEPAGHVSVVPRALPERSVNFDYEVRSLVDGTRRQLASDPLAQRPLPLVRIVVNATSIFLLVLFFGLTMAGTAPRLFGYEPVLVVSGSMEPAVRTSDIVVTTASDGLNLAPGTVINFETADGNVLHRIDEVTPGGYRTSGDANRSEDSGLVTPEQIRGIGVVIVPLIGLPSLWIDQGEHLKVVSVFFVMGAALYFSRRRWVYQGNEVVFG